MGYDYTNVKVISKGMCPYCKKPMIEHIIKEGARYHVLHWDSQGSHCSEPDCEKNHGIGKCVPNKRQLPTSKELDLVGGFS